MTLPQSVNSALRTSVWGDDNTGRRGRLRHCEEVGVSVFTDEAISFPKSHDGGRDWYYFYYGMTGKNVPVPALNVFVAGVT